MSVTIGVDVGGTKILAFVVTGDGEVLAEHRRPSGDALTSLDALVDAITSIVDELRGDGPAGTAAGRPVAGIGVGIAGMVALDGSVPYAPNIPGLRDAPVSKALAAAVGLPVAVDNDANVAGLGEAAHGAAVGGAHTLMVTLGTGIGGALVVDGRVYRGAHGFAAEIGHITVERDGPICSCGEPGHWEAIASGSALSRRARELAASADGGALRAAAGEDEVDGRHVAVAVRAGDAAAIALLERFADDVALGLAALANVLDPAVIVISGGLVELGPVLLDPMRAAFRVHVEAAAHRPEIEIVPAALGERAGAIGAAVLARP